MLWLGNTPVSMQWLLIFFVATIPFDCSGLVHRGLDEPRGQFQDITPKVLYESDRILAIDKPSGISHHNDKDGELGIVARLRLHYSKEKPNARLYGVHRLDRVTTGILLFAKDPEMAAILSRAFRENLITKYYVGISNRKPKKKKQGWVRGNMKRGRRKSWYLTRDEKASATALRSNYATTRFFTAGLGGLDNHRLNNNENDISQKEGEALSPATCLLFRPKTGRTHQLRVAAKSLGLPLLGDPLYGDLCTGQRTFLHAAAIHVPLDSPEYTDSGHDPVTIWCPPPFAELLWKENAQESFDEVLNNIFRKSCECPEILSVQQYGRITVEASDEI